MTNGNGNNGEGDLPDRQTDSDESPAPAPETPEDQGGQGGEPNPDITSTINVISKIVRDGGETAEGMREFAHWAREVMRDKKASRREKAAAGRLIANLSRTVVMAAGMQDKMQRLDEDRPTENLNVDGVKIIVKIPGEERFINRSGVEDKPAKSNGSKNGGS